jgi:hypothetical protein
LGPRPRWYDQGGGEEQFRDGLAAQCAAKILNEVSHVGASGASSAVIALCTGKGRGTRTFGMSGNAWNLSSS